MSTEYFKTKLCECELTFAEHTTEMVPSLTSRSIPSNRRSKAINYLSTAGGSSTLFLLLISKMAKDQAKF